MDYLIMRSLNKMVGNIEGHSTDELYTPKILVEAIKPFFEEWLNNWKSSFEPTIWLPFDTEKSEFYFFFKQYKVNVVYSHISLENGDFFERVKTQKADLVISNPPFTRKLDVFKALNDRHFTWVMLCNLECLNYQEVGKYFVEHPISLIIPDKKVSFDGRTSAFNTSYFCSYNFLKECGFSDNMKFIHLENNNSNKFFVPSRMYEDIDLKEFLDESKN